MNEYKHEHTNKHTYTPSSHIINAKYLHTNVEKCI